MQPDFFMLIIRMIWIVLKAITRYLALAWLVLPS